MSDRYYLWTTNGAKESGAGQEYRIKIPMRELDKMGFSWGYEATGEHQRDDIKAQLTSDICQFYSVSGPTSLHQIKTIRDIKPAKLNDVLRFPPVCVYDTDDNTDFVHPFNFTYVWLGVRTYPDAKFVKPGDCLAFRNHKDEEEILMEDGVTESHGMTFDIARNLQQMKIRHELIRTCHGATVSTPELASYFKNVIKQNNVYVFPNTIVPEDYEMFDTVRKDPNEVRILWQGSPSHYIDWYPLRDAIAEITRKYPQVKWVIYGWKFDWIHDLIPEDRLEFTRWQPYPAYKLRRGLLNIDINLCPLANNPFNRCKSAIKWYEGSIWNEPEATIAANVAPYKEIKDGVTGLLYDTPEELVQKIGLLIEDKALRQRLGHAAKKWVLNNRTPQHTIPGLAAFYDELKAQQKAALNPKIMVVRS